MRFRCPSCGFRGVVRVPELFPRGKETLVRCSRCQARFPLTVGRLWPQASEEAYGCLVTDAPGCRGETVGRLWVEPRGEAGSALPVLVLPPHPAFPHEIMHDPLDPLAAYTRLVFLELHGYAAGRQPFLPELLKDLESLRRKLAVPAFHLLAHLYSAPLALRLAERLGPQVCRSLVLVCPDLAPPPRSAGKAPLEARLAPLLREEGTELLAGAHLRGLAAILAPRTSADLLARGPEAGLDGAVSTGAHPAGAGGAAPDGTPDGRAPAGWPVPAAHAAEGARAGALRPGRRRPPPRGRAVPQERPAGGRAGGAGPGRHLGALAPRRAVRHPGLPLPAARRRPRAGAARQDGPRAPSLPALPVGWVAVAALVIGWALAFLSARLTFRPEYMGRVLPLLIASLLPLLWFLLPRGVPPGPLFRLDRGGGAAAPLGALAGLLFGGAAALGLRLLAEDGVLGRLLPLPPGGFVPAALGSLAPGAPGRPWLALAVLLSALPAIALPGNLLRLRRAPGRVLLPALLFALLPPLWPDLAWKLPLGLGAAFLFARTLSFWPPLALIAGFELAAGALASLLAADRLPPEAARILLEPATGPATALLLAGLGLLCLLGSPRRAPPPPARLYPPVRPAGYRWHTGWGVVSVILSSFAAAVLTVGFLQVAF